MAVRAVVCDPHVEHRVVSAGYDFQTIVWDLRYASQPTARQPIEWQGQRHSEFVTNLSISNFRPELVDCGWDSKLCFYNLSETK